MRSISRRITFAALAFAGFGGSALGAQQRITVHASADLAVVGQAITVVWSSTQRMALAGPPQSPIADGADLHFISMPSGVVGDASTFTVAAALVVPRRAGVITVTPLEATQSDAATAINVRMQSPSLAIRVYERAESLPIGRRVQIRCNPTMSPAELSVSLEGELDPADATNPAFAYPPPQPFTITGRDAVVTETGEIGATHLVARRSWIVRFDKSPFVIPPLIYPYINSETGKREVVSCDGTLPSLSAR